MSRVIPTINTKGLTLRALRPDDFDRYAEIWAMADVTCHIGGAPWSRSQAWDSFLRNAGHWQMTGFGQWAIEAQGTKSLVGQTGFSYGVRGLGADFDIYPEAAWVLSPDVQGRGLGRQAAQAAHDWFDRVVTGPLVCRISPDNAVSLRLAGTLGYKPLRRTEVDGAAVDLMIRKSPP
ncbi:GNAT family N-acetyltransferase [Pseudosulfitobacter koreensis]|uniref:GNAT family N-acetyltransferase n=1 Tax=Pseudosulfitobacter koreensis TaxID=2968472 RepID=A0ABT1YXR2_9RHOB|nr:GNAT family protein [Pseudosulfitobacter koreense]MCR8825670.1 GNAT family N-acetyltransferase [Pseudosulfitobacter koreense]